MIAVETQLEDMPWGAQGWGAGKRHEFNLHTSLKPTQLNIVIGV
jgi:hypothetical protein